MKSLTVALMTILLSRCAHDGCNVRADGRAHRGLRRHRRHTVDRARRAQRIDRLALSSTVRLRFVLPWVRRIDGRLHLIAGPDALVLATPARLEARGMTTIANLHVREGDRIPFVLTWHPSYEQPPPSPDAFEALRDTEEWWHDWVS